MGHDVHFLERLERVNPEHQALALRLYRDPALVKRVVGVVCRLAGVPDDVADARVALALEDGGQGPHVIVTRAGRFVTCLASGMSVGALPVLSRALLDSDAEWIHSSRRYNDYKDDEMDTLFKGILDHDLWPSRAQIEELEPFCSFHLKELLSDHHETAVLLRDCRAALLNTVRGMRRVCSYDSVEGRVIRSWGTHQRYLVHTLVLMALGVHRSSPLFRLRLEPSLIGLSYELCLLTTPAAMLRAVWLFMQLEHLSPAVMRERLKPSSALTYLLHMPVLLGRMLNADRAEAARFERMLDAYQAELEASGGHESMSRCIALLRLCWEHRARPLHERAALISARLRDPVPEWQRRFYDPALLEREPERAVQDVLACDDSILSTYDEHDLLMLYVPEIVRRSAPLLYPIHPPTLTKRERYDRDVALLQSIRRREHLLGCAVAAKTQGRNDPCACGSGKKYKKCCGAAEA